MPGVASGATGSISAMPHATDTARVLVALAIGASPSPEFSAINFVNATGLAGKLEIRADGEPLSREGYAHGDCSGGLLFPPDRAIRVEATAPGCGPCPPVRLAPVPGGSRVIVFYAAPSDPAGAWPLALRARVLDHREPSARRSVTAIYLGEQPFLRARSGGDEVHLPRGAPAEIWRGEGAPFTVALPWGRIDCRLEEPGHYWLILHDRDRSPSGHLLVPDPVYEIPVFGPPPS